MKCWWEAPCISKAKKGNSCSIKSKAMLLGGWSSGLDKKVSPLSSHTNTAVVHEGSFSELFVKYLETKFHSAFPTAKKNTPLCDMKLWDSTGKTKQAYNVPLFNLPEEPHPKTGVNPCSTAVSLNPPGPATGGPGHPLLNATAKVVLKTFQSKIEDSQARDKMALWNSGL